MALLQNPCIELVQCCLCHQVGRAPFLLKCFHVYCERCLPALKEFSQRNRRRHPQVFYECTVCFTQSPEACISQNRFLEKVSTRYDFYFRVTSSWPSCSNCRLPENATYFCDHCQMYLCERCINCQNHKILNLSANYSTKNFQYNFSHFKIAQTAFKCERHPIIPAVLFCRGCNKLVCTLCQCPPKHWKQTILRATRTLQFYLQRKIDYIDDGIVRIKEHLQEVKDLERMSRAVRALPTIADDVKVKNQCDRKLRFVQGKYNDYKQNGMRVIKWANAAMRYLVALKHHVSPLTASFAELVADNCIRRNVWFLIGELRGSLQSLKVEHWSDRIPKTGDASVDQLTLIHHILLNPACAMKIGGKLDFTRNPRYYPQVLIKAFACNIVWEETVDELPMSAESFVVESHERLCLCDTRTSHVKFEYEQFRLSTIKRPRAMQFLNSRTIIVSGECGIYVLDEKTAFIIDKLSQFAHGRGLWVNLGVVTALKVHTNEVLEFDFRSDTRKRLAKMRVFRMCHQKFTYDDTVAVFNKYIYIATSAPREDFEHKDTIPSGIFVYNREGETLMQCGSYTGLQPGILMNPLILGVSDDGQLVVTDSRNGKLSVVEMLVKQSKTRFTEIKTKCSEGQKLDMTFKNQKLYLLLNRDGKHCSIAQCQLKFKGVFHNLLI